MYSFEAKNVSKKFVEVEALKNSGLKFEIGKICGLVGANGSGKTTFSRICSGLLKADSGEFFIDGKEVILKSALDARRHGIVLVHQNLSLISELTVWENICLVHENRTGKIFSNDRRNKEEAGKILDELIPGIIRLDEKIVNLSPEQKQMVEITKALYQKPQLLILDEPTAALEYLNVERLFSKVQQLKNENTLIIFISHRLWEVAKICDEVFVFRDGETVGHVDFTKQSKDENVIVPLITGKKIENKVSNKKISKNLDKADISIEVKNIYFKDKLKDISFRVKKGEILGIGGLTDQGQQEMIMLLTGALRTSAGKIFLNNKEVKLKNTNYAIKLGIFLVPGDKQIDGLFIDHSIFENLIIPRITLKKDKFFLNFKKLNKVVDKVIDEATIVPPNRKIIVKNLSGGNQQKVVFGRWLQFLPTVLLLNDPAKGIDIQARSDLYEIVRELSNKGISVILYASANEELIENCDRVLIMFEGEIVKELSKNEITDDSIIKHSLRVGVEEQRIDKA